MPPLSGPGAAATAAGAADSEAGGGPGAGEAVGGLASTKIGEHQPSDGTGHTWRHVSW